MTSSNNRPRKRKNKNFEPTEKLAEVWAELKGYGIYTHDRDGNIHEWAMSRKQCNKRLQEVQQKFNLSGLNQTREAMLSIPMYNGDLDNYGLTPVQLLREVHRVSQIRTILLTTRLEEDETLDDLVDELEDCDHRDLQNLRNDFRDRFWKEARREMDARVKKAVKSGKKKGKILTRKKSRQNG